MEQNEVTRPKRGRPSKKTVEFSESGGWLKLKNAAEFLDVGLTKMRELAKSGEIPYSTEGGTSDWRFRIKDLDAYAMRYYAKIK